MYIDPEDFPFTSVPADIFSLLEPCIMIICACLPIMRPLVRRILPSAVSAKLSGSSRRAGYGGYGKSVGEEGLSQKKLHEKFGKKGFVKQDDEVMLTEMSYKTGEMENNTGERIIRDNDNEFVAVLETPEQSEKNPRPDWTRSSSRNRIEVTQEWTVKVERQ